MMSCQQLFFYIRELNIKCAYIKIIKIKCIYILTGHFKCGNIINVTTKERYVMNENVNQLVKLQNENVLGVTLNVDTKGEIVEKQEAPEKTSLQVNMEKHLYDKGMMLSNFLNGNMHRYKSILEVFVWKKRNSFLILAEMYKKNRNRTFYFLVKTEDKQK